MGYNLAMIRPLSRFSPVPGRPITGREIEVLRCLASGRTYREIAGLLALSPHTVRRHMEHIYKKLGVQSKVAAVNRGKEHNIFG